MAEALEEGAPEGGGSVAEGSSCRGGPCPPGGRGEPKISRSKAEDPRAKRSKSTREGRSGVQKVRM